MKKNVAIVGGGWNAVHTALVLSAQGHYVTIFQNKDRLFSGGASGSFGIRLHNGPHYPRSKATRESCSKGYHDFVAKYPDLIVRHFASLYTIGDTDADGNASKVTPAEFIRVCKENSTVTEIDLNRQEEVKGMKLANLLTVLEVSEPSIKVGPKLHDYFVPKLDEAKVTVNYESAVTAVDKVGSGKFHVSVNGEVVPKPFDEVVNATGYQALLPSHVTLPFSISYEPTVALIYKVKESATSFPPEPISFTVMDGMFPCIMPVVEYEPTETKHAPQQDRRYMLTHCKYSVLERHTDLEAAKKEFDKLSDEYVEENIRPHCEKEISRFMPEFGEYFEPDGWRVGMVPKPKTSSDLRAAMVFRDEHTGIVHVISGKISNVDAVAFEVDCFVKGKKIVVVPQGKYSYIEDGTFCKARPEFDINKTRIQKLNDLRKKLPKHKLLAMLAMIVVGYTQLDFSDPSKLALGSVIGALLVFFLAKVIPCIAKSSCVQAFWNKDGDYTELLANPNSTTPHSMISL